MSTSLWVKTQSGFVAVDHLAAIETKVYPHGDGGAAVVARLAVTAGDSEQGLAPEYRQIAQFEEKPKAAHVVQRLVWQIVRRQASGLPGILSVDKGGDVVFDRVSTDT